MNMQLQVQAKASMPSFIPAQSALLQRKCACGGTPGVDGECAECRAKRMSMQPSATTTSATSPTVPPIVHDVLSSSGQPLDARTRTFMAPRFGHDFSNVRVHTDAKAAESARSVNALAYTVGKDVVFGTGQYAPGTIVGQKLLAHELTHVIQQQNTQMANRRKLEIGNTGDIYEHEANSIVSSLETGNHISRRTPHDVVQRQVEGPQSLGATTAPEAIDPTLFAYNRNTVEKQLFMEAQHYRQLKDLRWFFTYSHAMITKQINDNIHVFQRPNALLRLNVHFAETFLRAVGGQPSGPWQEAFRFCSVFDKAIPVELCGMKMAKVHIDIDLAAALREVGCIPPTDYGNMLVLVNRGQLAATQHASPIGWPVETVVSSALDLVKEWRNASYQKVCNTPVPEVEPGFGKRIK